MTIQVRCPNSACGKILSVRDDFAGKTGKCPSCGTTMPIPYPGEASGPSKPSSRVRPERAEEDDDDRVAPSRSRRRRDDDDDDVPVASSRSRRRREEEDDYDDDDYDDRRPRRRSRYDEPRGRKRAGGSFVGTLVCLGIGIGLLLFLGFIPLFSWASVSVSADMRNPNLPGGRVSKSESKSSDSLFKGDKEFDGGWQGKVILIVTLVVAVFALVSLILFLTIHPAVSDLILTISGCVAGGWSMTVLLWLVGFIWKVFTFSSKAKEQIKKTAAFGLSINISISPGVGMWIGLVLALVTVGVFSTLMTLRGKTLWIYLGEGVGLLLGVLLMLLAVQPWKVPEEIKPGGGKGFGPFMQQVLPHRPVLVAHNITAGAKRRST